MATPFGRIFKALDMRSNFSGPHHRQMIRNSEFPGLKLDILATSTALASSPALSATRERARGIFTQKAWVETAKKSPFLMSVPGISPHATRMSKGRS